MLFQLKPYRCEYYIHGKLERKLIRLVKINTITIDFSNKVKGSLVENPHIVRATHYSDSGGYDTSGTLLLPSQVPELSSQFKYDSLKTKNGSGLISYGDDNTRAQMIFSFNLIRPIEEYYGASVWKGATTTAEKIEVLKTFWGASDSFITATVSNTSSGSPVYRRYTSVLKNTNEWVNPIGMTTASGMVETARGFFPLEDYIHSDGYVHYTLYTDIDTLINGTYNVTMNVDYVRVDIIVREDLMILNAPTGLTATATAQKIELSWTEVSGATSYNVKRSKTSGANYVSIANVTGASYEDVTSEKDESTYYYVVTAINVAGESLKSAEVVVTAVPRYTEVSVYIHPSKWSGGTFSESLAKELIEKYNQPNKRQEISGQPPIINIVTYND